MILGNSYVIYEYQDIFTAADAMDDAAGTIGAILQEFNPGGRGTEIRDKFLDNLEILLAAAGVGAAVSKHQGGLLVMQAGCTEENMNEANEALLQLRKQNRGTCQTTYC